MTPEQRAAKAMSDAAYVMARVAGMQAQNAICLLNNRTPCYGESAFEELANFVRPDIVARELVEG